MPPIICQLLFRFAYPDTEPHRVVCLWVSAFISSGFLYPSVGLSNFNDRSLPCDLTSLLDPRKVDDFWSV